MSAKIKEELRQAYEQRAAFRDKRPIPDWKLAERQRFLALLQAEGKQTLLEIGAGTGIDGRFFQDQGLDVTCVDLTAANVALCRQKGLTAHVMEAADLQFPDGTFDAVYTFNCLLHLTKPEMSPVLLEIRRVLKQNGLFYLGMYGGYDHAGVWQDDFYEPKRFYSFYADEHLQEVVTAVFHIHTFNTIRLPDRFDKLHFQSLILKP